MVDNPILAQSFCGKITMTQPTIFSKIVSGGQTGVDQGALDAALALNHPCGGWCPKGRLSESGPIPDTYPVREHPSERYDVRTEANGKDSDGTLVFTFGTPTGGTAYTVEVALKLDKPIFIIDLEFDPINVSFEQIWDWGRENEIVTLNVAGPRESKAPGIHNLVQGIMLEMLRSDKR